MSRIKALKLVGLGLVLPWAAIWLIGGRLHQPGEQPAPQVVVCIDPGHPSETNSGRVIQNGVSELEINWAVALKLETILKRDSRIAVIKTRESMDEFTRNRDRAIIGNSAGAALNIHLHCDAGPSRGFTTYYPDREGKSLEKRGPSRDVIESSEAAAWIIHSEMAMELNGLLRDRGIKGESHTRIGRINGALTTSIWSEIPTVTVEMVFLSNRSDAAFIKTEEGQWKMAQALARGIKAFIKPQLDSLPT